ncbi:MAG: molybdopterin-dependent oxidoreductase [Desulfobacter sp.]|nr:MAG: molybdopterin-dependent oxidoreductase [Desulfobacter sp.]
MTTRRQVIKKIAHLLACAWILFGKFGTGAALAFGRFKKKILPKGTAMNTLISQNPAKLDTRLLDTSPEEEFDVMGQDIYDVDIKNWRLELSGAVKTPADYTYDDLFSLPSIEKNVLLICPGFFAYNARWKGISSRDLLSAAGLDPSATHVKFSGPEGIRKKTKKFTINEVMANDVFIAFQVNGKVLPQRHGFPARLVAGGHYGGEWVKYVNKMVVIAR